MMNAAEIAAAKVLPPPATRRALRLAAGLTTQEIADIVGVTRDAISKYELGTRQPTGPRRTAYAKALADLRRYVAELEE